MTLNEALLSLLDRIGGTGESQNVTWQTIQLWPSDILRRFMELEILTLSTTAQSIECQGCENRCFKEVLRLPNKLNQATRAFVVCDDPEMQNQMGRIEIPQQWLQQWKVTTFQLAKVVANLLAIENKIEYRHEQSNIRIGMVKNKKRRRWLFLNKSPLTLEINGHHLPLEEVISFEGDTLTIDRDRINYMIDKAPCSSEKKYTPSTDKRISKKQKTEAMYDDWRDSYKRLRHEHPDTVRYTDRWISLQIAKLDIANNRSPETIRKKMKK